MATTFCLVSPPLLLLTLLQLLEIAVLINVVAVVVVVVLINAHTRRSSVLQRPAPDGDALPRPPSPLDEDETALDEEALPKLPPRLKRCVRRRPAGAQEAESEQAEGLPRGKDMSEAVVRTIQTAAIQMIESEVV